MAEELKDQPVESTAADAVPDAAAESGAEEGVYSNDDVAALLEGGADGEDSAQEAGAEAQPREGAPAEATAAESQEQPAAVMPQGWEEADWKALPAAAQTRIAQSEQAHAAALSREIEARQAMAAEKERYTADVNREVSLALSTMQQIVEGEFSQVDWKQLAETDPKTYVQLQQAYDARMASIRQIQQNLGARVQQMQQERAAAAQRAMHAERDKVLPELAAMFGSGFDGRKFGEAARNYLRAQGVPETAVAAMSQGYEVKMVAKAMLYDYQAAQRAKAQQKVAEAPRVSSAGKTAPADGSAKLKKALARLNSHPRSTDAIADIFEML